MGDITSRNRRPNKGIEVSADGDVSASDSAPRIPVLGDANELVPKLLRLEDGYWEQLVEIAAELSALRHERVGVNGLIREVLIEGLELRPPQEIQARRVTARKEYEARVADIEAKIAAGQASKLSVRDRMFYAALKPAEQAGSKRGKGGRPRKSGQGTDSLD